MTDRAARAVSLTLQLTLLLAQIIMLGYTIRSLGRTCAAVYPEVAAEFVVCRILLESEPE